MADSGLESWKSLYPLHECVFNGDVGKLSGLIRIVEKQAGDIGLSDPHGNTPLHLAVMLGRKELVHLLLAHDAPVKVKNKAGWSPLAEAISYGDRQTIANLLRKLKQQSRDRLRKRKPEMVESLKRLGDFAVDLKWDFTSWIPLISKILPSDVCKITKKGANVRLDTTLVDFTEMKWERGDITFLYRGHAASSSNALLVLDNKLKVFQKVRTEESEPEFEDEVDLLMYSDIISAQGQLNIIFLRCHVSYLCVNSVSTKPISFSRAQSGWIFREDKREMVGTYNATFYHVNGIALETRKRREHLSKEDLRKNKALLENFAKGHVHHEDENGESEFPRKESLPPPAENKVTWLEYIAASAGSPPPLGRPLVCKESSKGFKATVAMSEDFPLSVEMLLNILEVSFRRTLNLGPAVMKSPSCANVVPVPKIHILLYIVENSLFKKDTIFCLLLLRARGKSIICYTC